MKAPILLKTIVDICFFFLIISFSGALIATVLAIFSDTETIPFELNGTVRSDLTPTNLSLLFIEILIAGLTVYTILILRKLIRNFFKGKFFTRYQIDSLNLIGHLITLITIVRGLTSFLAEVLLKNTLQLRLGLDLSFTSFWFVLAIGLFFIYLSKLFDNARTMKEENELTV